MRIFEFAGDDGLDKFIVVLKNFVGRYTSKSQPGSLNWKSVSSLAKKAEFEVLGDPRTGYETFKSLWDGDPNAKALLEPLIKNFNANGIELNVPGAPDAEKEPTQDSETSAEKIDKIASAAAPKQLAQSQAGIKI